MTREENISASSSQEAEILPDIDFEVKLRPPVDDRTSFFDPVLCAALHNDIVSHLLKLEPSWRPHVRRNLFTVPPCNFVLHPSLNADRPDPSASVSEDELRSILGDDLSTFFELIDTVSFTSDRVDENGQQYKAYDSRFLPKFDSPDLSLLFEFGDEMAEVEFWYVIQLYPVAHHHALEAQYGGILFDIQSGMAMFARPILDGLGIPPSNSWVPLDIVLKEWLRMFDDGRIYRDGEAGLQEKKWIEKDLQEALGSWNQYLDLLENMVGCNDKQTSKAQAGAMVDSESLEKWDSVLNDFSAAFLRRARRPLTSITDIAPGVSYFNSQSFNVEHETQRFYDQDPGDDTNALYASGRRRQLAEDGIRVSLVFPAVGAHTTIPAKWHCLMDTSCEMNLGMHLLNRKAGLYIAYESNDAVMVDHEGRTQTFQRKSRCPWREGGMQLSLSDMFRAWRIMLETGQWVVGPCGVEGDYTWFARSRKIEWIPNTHWPYTIQDSDGEEEVKDMKNDWVEWNELLD